MPKPKLKALVIGGGLAGCEAAWQLARRGIQVALFEMRPKVMTPAHRTPLLAELVCSNSLRSDDPIHASSLLKAELEAAGSLIMQAARSCSLPAGSALAVDRQRFSQTITTFVEEHPLISVIREEVKKLPGDPAIVATGPLTSPTLLGELQRLLGCGALHFYDAIAPTVSAASLDLSRMFFGSRFGRGSDYLNAPMDRELYHKFVESLVSAETVPLREFESFEELQFFEGCLPVEEIARRGPETLRGGPMSPQGLVDPKTGKRPYAVVQLRRDDLAAEYWNLVGFQTKLTIPEQKRVFRMIPGLENAVFTRFGSVHRNVFVDAPGRIDPWLRVVNHPTVWIAGQLSGVEGYLESAATGLLAGLFMAGWLVGGELPPLPPRYTALRALLEHVSAPRSCAYQPSKITWGLIGSPPELRSAKGKRERRELQRAAALEGLSVWLGELEALFMSRGTSGSVGARMPRIADRIDFAGRWRVQLEEYRQMLKEKRRELLARVRSVLATSSQTGDEVPDLGDRALSTISQEVLLELSESERRILKLIDEALDRMEKGTYGICVHCGRQIQEARLAAVPWARHCIECQELQDRGLL